LLGRQPKSTINAFSPKNQEYSSAGKGISSPSARRWTVLTPNYLLTFQNEREYSRPTEVIPLKAITAIRLVDEDETRQTFVTVAIS